MEHTFSGMSLVVGFFTTSFKLLKLFFSAIFHFGSSRYLDRPEEIWSRIHLKVTYRH